MNTKPAAISAAIASLLALGLTSGHAAAAIDMENMEKCFAIAKAGKNDCAGNKSAHACASRASQSGDPLDWVVVPKGTCGKIAGGSLKPVRKNNPGG